MLKSPRALAGLCLLLWAATGAGAEVKLAPVDEGAADPGWQRFKARLIDALARRDAQFIAGIIDRNIRNTSGTDGAAEFMKLWEPRSAESPLWTELPKVLFLGGVFVKRGPNAVEFCAPYVYYRWPDAADFDSAGAIIVREALLKVEPAADAATRQTLSYEVVKVVDWEVGDRNKGSSQKWVKVATAAGEGYVPEEQVRSPLEYRACFAQSGSRWRMTELAFGE